MTEDQNPFVHPARERFQQLLDEAEDLAQEQVASQPLHDPLERYHLAADWGLDPWVVRMWEADQYVARLRAEATAVVPDPETAAGAFKEAAVGALQAMVLFEEQIEGDPTLDDQQFAAFLDRLRDQLDTRIARLQKPAEEDQYLGMPELTEEEKRAHHEHVHFNWEHNLPPEEYKIKDKDKDGDLPPGLAFAPPYGDTVAGEGNDGTPPARRDNAKPLIQVEEVPANTQAHDFRPSEDEPVDLDKAERALAREVTALKQEAAGSSAVQFGGRHASPADTDPDMGATGRYAKGEED